MSYNEIENVRTHIQKVSSLYNAIKDLKDTVRTLTMIIGIMAVANIIGLIYMVSVL